MRLKPEFLSVTVADKNIYEVCQMSAGKCYEFFKEVTDKNSNLQNATECRKMYEKCHCGRKST